MAAAVDTRDPHTDRPRGACRGSFSLGGGSTSSLSSLKSSCSAPCCPKASSAVRLLWPPAPPESLSDQLESSESGSRSMSESSAAAGASRGSMGGALAPPSEPSVAAPPVPTQLIIIIFCSHKAGDCDRHTYHCWCQPKQQRCALDCSPPVGRWRWAFRQMWPPHRR
jgi:hypothetical protein